jgi:YfiH family protein
VSRKTTKATLDVLTARNLEQEQWLLHGFSTRNGGVSSAYGKSSLNLGITKHDQHSNVEHNRELFLRELGAANGRGRLWPLVGVRQIHSAVIHRVTGVPGTVLVGDGLITDTPRFLLTVKTADCVPVLLADSARRAVGAFHAGWKGTLARIVEKGVGELRRYCGSKPEDIRAAIGPCIHACCYEVGEELREKFDAQFPYAGELFSEVFDYQALSVKYPMLFLNQRPPGHGEPAVKIHLNLVEANRRQLVDAGVRQENVEVVDECTSCNTDLLFSHRKEAGMTGRMMGVIGIR